MRADYDVRRYDAARCTESICRSHPSSWFQLAKMWLTTSNWLIPKAARPDAK